MQITKNSKYTIVLAEEEVLELIREITEAYNTGMQQKTLLVIGTGNIGGRVVEKMKAFMQVDTFDIQVNSLQELEHKIKKANCISLHIPLTAATTNLFDAELPTPV